MIEEKLKSIVEKFEKEIGPISFYLSENDDYKKKLIQDAKNELAQKIIDSIGLKAEFFEIDTGCRPRNDMPAFEASRKKKILKFSLTN